MAKYIYQHENWTNFIWNEDKIRDLFGEVKYLQGKLNGIKIRRRLTHETQTALMICWLMVGSLRNVSK